MSEWKSVEISEVCELIVDCVNKTAPIVDFETDFKMLRTTNIRNGRVDTSVCRFVEKEVFNKWTRRSDIRRGDVILTREAPIGEVGMIKSDEKLFLGQRLMQYRANPKKIDEHFLLYSFLSKDLQHQFRMHEGTGSVVSHIRVGDCFKFKINLPSLPTQKAIGEILSSLDNKIDLNNQINQNLEALAQALFKQWFVDFEFLNENGEPYKSSGGEMIDSELGEIPKGWSVVNLDKLLTIKYGKDHKGIPEGQIPIYGSGGIMRFGNRALYEKVSILIPRKGTLTNLFFITDPFWSVDTMFYSEIHSDEFAEFLFFWIKSLDIASMNVGSAVPSMTTKVLNQLLVLKPDENTIRDFHEVTKGIFDTTKANNKENENLKKLRDTLLPQLISGNLKIN